ncbi:type II toxin-antitoxin system HipA family toxin [Sulfurimonas sp.]|uniref:type II toxin-antitoxin system HipA family toxin n=1 Tax=Sulfurimonas sp. TaxID=2022749 RepID=UPI002AB04825|nr:type II toxin-antitoxin system HipA family toxin [Sulfurimonas sp.]
MKENNLKVFINKSPSGYLSYEDEKYIFNYNNQAKKLVSLTMPIRNESWVSKKLHPIFQMNMPEGALKDVIKNHFSKIQKMDDINFLKLIGPYMLGRVKFNTLLHTEENLTLDSILKNNKENLFEELMQKFAIRSGISGVQPKLLLSAHNKTTMKFEHYIVKSFEINYPELALNEYFCMKAVQNANLPTPDFHLSDDRSMFIMKRFDVKDDGSYFGFEDMCVLTARGTDEKYDGSYEECVRVIKDIIPPQKRKISIKIFFKAIIMNHLLQNGDGHLKNYGVVYNNDYQDATLAPIYDVITTTIYIKKDIPALKLSDAKLWFKEKTYRKFAFGSCGLSKNDYENILRECENAIKKTKKEIDDYKSKDKKVIDFLTSLKECWKDKF